MSGKLRRIWKWPNIFQVISKQLPIPYISAITVPVLAAKLRTPQSKGILTITLQLMG
jgi:hypothetical protein